MVVGRLICLVVKMSCLVNPVDEHAHNITLTGPIFLDVLIDNYITVTVTVFIFAGWLLEVRLQFQLQVLFTRH